MTRKDTEAWVASRREALNRHDTAALTRMFDPECVVDSPTAGGSVRGLTAVDEVHRAWAIGFPDVTFTTDDLLIDGDRLVWVVTAAGTDTGGFMRLPPTGRPFVLPMVLFTTLRKGLIVSERRIYDFTGMLMQIGVLKARPSAVTPAAIAASHAEASVIAPTADAAAPSREDVVEILTRRHQAWTNHDSRALGAQHAPDAVMDSHLAGRVQGASNISDVYASWFTAFPDSQATSDEVIVDGTRAAELATMTGTDTGGFLGQPPTRKPFHLRSAWLYTIQEGRFVHVQPVYDFTGMLVQIGAIKAKPQ